MASGSCGDVVRQGRSPSFLVIESLAAASGSAPDQVSSTLQSDVVTLVRTTINGQQVSVPTVLQDAGQASFRLALKDPGAPAVPSTPSDINAVTINRYHVVFKRSDGRNVPGVDVPFAFDGAVTATISSSSSVVVPFVLVRIQAKLEAPLKAMQGLGASIAISTIADVTFYGRDQAGNDVSVTGSISVNFADWADPAGS